MYYMYVSYKSIAVLLIDELYFMFADPDHFHIVPVEVRSTTWYNLYINRRKNFIFFAHTI